MNKLELIDTMKNEFEWLPKDCRFLKSGKN